VADGGHQLSMFTPEMVEIKWTYHISPVGQCEGSNLTGVQQQGVKTSTDHLCVQWEIPRNKIHAILTNSETIIANYGHMKINCQLNMRFAFIQSLELFKTCHAIWQT